MSEYLKYLLEKQGYIGYRKFLICETATVTISALYQENLFLETSQRKQKEENERSHIADLLTQQTRDREERARGITENQGNVVERIKKEQQREKAEELRRLQKNTSLFNDSLESQRKAAEQKRIKKEQELLEEKRRLKELKDKAEREKAMQRELERKREQEDFTSKEEELLESIEQTEQAISRLKSEIETETNLADKTNRETLQLLETLKATQQNVLHKEEENLEWKKRCELSERLRRETEEAFRREKEERQREEAQMQLAQLESSLTITDGNLMQKWRCEELNELKKEIADIRKDFEKGNFDTVRLTGPELHRKLEALEQQALADEKQECQREYVAKRFFEALKYLGYNDGLTMFQQNPKDPRSPVIIKGSLPSGKALELTIPFGDIYSIKFSGTNEERHCCSEEAALREIMEKFGVSNRALEPVNQHHAPNGKPGLKLQFKDGNKKIELTQQFCG